MPGGEFVCRVVRNGHLALIPWLSDRLEQILAALHVLWIFEKKKKTPVCTPPKINIEPENDGLEGDFPLPEVYSQVPC